MTYNKHSTVCDCMHDIIDHDFQKGSYECFYQYNCGCKKFTKEKQEVYMNYFKDKEK